MLVKCSQEEPQGRVGTYNFSKLVKNWIASRQGANNLKSPFHAEPITLFTFSFIRCDGRSRCYVATTDYLFQKDCLKYLNGAFQCLPSNYQVFQANHSQNLSVIRLFWAGIQPISFQWCIHCIHNDKIICNGSLYDKKKLVGKLPWMMKLEPFLVPFQGSDFVNCFHYDPSK